MLKNFRKNQEGVVLLFIGIVVVLAMVVFGVLMFFVVDMLTRNILPICIGIALVVVLPIIAKGWYYSKTKKEYPKGGGLF